MRRVLFYITLQLALASVPCVLGATHLPIIFIHGIQASSGTWDKESGSMIQWFKNAGFLYGDDLYYSETASTVISRKNPGHINKGDLYTISFYDRDSNFSSNNLLFEEQGYQLKKVIDAVKTQTGFCKVILIGHSMGGLAARWYVENLNRLVSASYSKDVAAFFTIGTPNEGVILASIPSLIGGVAYVSLGASL